MSGNKKKTGGGVAGIIVAIILAIAVPNIGQGGMLVGAKDAGTKLFHRSNTASHSVYIRAHLKNVFFNDPTSCKSAAIVCKAKAPGVSAEEVKSLERAGAKNIKTSTVTRPSDGKLVHVILV
jgi:hypothetical protein